MKVGDMVKHIEWEVVGLTIQQSAKQYNRWLVYFNDCIGKTHWCTECELSTDFGGKNE